MLMRHFYLDCFKRAGRGKLLHVEAISGFLALVCLPVATYWNFFGSEILNWLPLIIFGTVFLGTVAIGLLTAPYKIADQLERDRNALREKLDERVARQAALNELWRLRSDGITLRNTRVTSDPSFAEWIEKSEAWRSEVLERAEVISMNLRNWLDRLDRCNPPPQMPWPWHNDDHAHRVKIFSEILLRMQTFLEKDLIWPTPPA